MNITFLGTGAAEMNPNPFCNCSHCETARKLISEGKRKPRRRSCAMLGTRTCVDFGPDVMASVMDFGVSFTELRSIFITHTHEDHLSFSNINVHSMTARPSEHAVTVYMSPEGFRWLFGLMAESKHHSPVTGMEDLIKRNLVRFAPFEPYRDHKIDGMIVFAVQSNHMSYGEGEYALNYRFTFPDGKRLLYVADSGLYSEDNLKALEGSSCDVLIMESTRGIMETPEHHSHLNGLNFIENVRRFSEYGIISPDAKIYATHLATSTDNYLSDEDFENRLKEGDGRIILAYDGMKADL
ncbi:MAG: hypothetical protein GX633_04340 [Clostridiales bacterium]|nr:hypothetical protein [Clostridiales bacterium]